MVSTYHLLIPLADNHASYHSLAYCALLFSEQQNCTFQLLHCSSQSPSSLLPEPSEPRDSLFPHCSSLQEQEVVVHPILEKGLKILEEYGVQAANISTSHVSSARQIAQTIIHQADHHLSDCIVVSRRGVGYLAEIILGSVSATLCRSSHNTPLWLIDGEVKSKDVLVAVDGSLQTLRAVDHLAFMLQNRTDISIYLYHCSLFLAPPPFCRIELFYGEWDREWCKRHLSGDGCLFNGPRQLLRDAGIPPERIITLPETRQLEESTSIISQARSHGCGTILLGRRTPEARKGFFRGVSNRTIRQTQDMAVWVIG